ALVFDWRRARTVVAGSNCENVAPCDSADRRRCRLSRYLLLLHQLRRLVGRLRNDQPRDHSLGAGADLLSLPHLAHVTLVEGEDAADVSGRQRVLVGSAGVTRCASRNVWKTPLCRMSPGRGDAHQRNEPVETPRVGYAVLP